MKITTRNSMALCQSCAMAEFKRVSREYRPYVWQWVVYGSVVVPSAVKVNCFKCLELIK